MFEHRVDFTAHQNDKSADVHPGQQHDDGADTAVSLVVGAEVIDVVGKTQ